jgi:error-prone DNA polymerase
MATTTDLSSDYVELRCHSAFTFLDGASLPEALVLRAGALGYRALALTDRDGLYGAPRFFRATQKWAEAQNPALAQLDRRDAEALDAAVKTWPLRPLFGAELSLSDGHRLTVLVENRTGYRNLSRLITNAHQVDCSRPQGKVVPRVSLVDVAAHAGGLIALSGGEEGRVGAFIARGDEIGTRRALGELIEIFGRRGVYAELGRHFEAEEDLRNERLLRVAGSLDLPIVATNDVRYAAPADRRLYDALVCIRHRKTVDEIGRDLPLNGERYLKSPIEMAHLFRDLPEAIWRTREVAERCAFSLAQLGYRFPSYPLPQGVPSTQALLEQLTWAGAAQRYRPLDPDPARQIRHELEIIGRLGLAGYFLIVWDLVEFCRSAGIMVQGRGSAANSAVCYALGITAVDAVKMKLLFERFLSEERGEWPDIDLDLPSGEARERVIQYVYERYGRYGAAMTANIITYRPKMAVRDVGRALGFEEAELNRMSRLLSGWGYRDPNDSLARRIVEAGFTLSDERTRLLIELSERLCDLPRHLGQHSGGMVISDGRLDEIVPLEPATMPGRVVIQWDKDDCADLGIIKVDLLGLGMMAVLAEAVSLVKEHEGIAIDLAQLPPDDEKIYELLQKADTVGIFQVESRAQMAILPRLQPRCFYDIVVEVAIIRPGPIVGDMLHPFLRRRAGREAPDPLHPSLKEVLDRTLGVPLFQEQLMRIAMIAANFTGGQAEELRRAMGFKRSEARMREIEVALRAGMAQNNIVGESAERILRAITSFALYGFPESHAASFALLVYASCYLKVHHPAAFYAALLNQWPMGFYHPATLVRDAMRRGVEIRAIDVQYSDFACTLEEGAVRMGLRYVGGLPEEGARRIERERRAARFGSVAEFVRRVALAPQRSTLTALAESGALSSLGGSRRSALWQVEAIERSGPLYLGVSAATSVELPEMDEHEMLAADYRISGLSTGRHPIALRRDALTRAGVISTEALKRHSHGQRVRIAGTVIVRQRPGTAKGFFFLTLEDETGLSNIIVTPNRFEAERTLLVSSPALIVEGRLQKVDGTLSIKADRFWALQEVGAPSHDFH